MNAATITKLNPLLPFIFMGLVTGCLQRDEGSDGHSHTSIDRHGHDEQDDHAHEMEEKTAQITVWDDKYEIFMEHAYLVTNVPTRFITHVTNLQTLQPRRFGEVTFIFDNGNGNPTEHREEAPVRDGIYIPELTFPVSGDWTVMLRIGTGPEAHDIKLQPFKVYASQHDVDHAPDPVEYEGITFLKEQQWRIPCETVPVTRQSITERLPLIGTVSACPNFKAVVSPPVSGQLHKSNGTDFPQIGDEVEAGRVLALVQPPLAGADLLSMLNNKTQLESIRVEYTVKAAEARARLEGTDVALNQARRSLFRTKELHAQQAKSDRELEETEFLLQKIQAEKQAIENLLKSYEKALADIDGQLQGQSFGDSYPALEITAPLSGTVVDVHVTDGEYVRPEEALFTLLNNRRLHIAALVPEADVARIGASPDVLCEMPASQNEMISLLQSNLGKMVFFGKEVNVATRTVPLVYEVDNTDLQLRIGMAINMHVATGTVENALIVPHSALIDEDGQTIAFVMLAGETFEKRYLELGVRSGEVAQVLSGLNEGERVVSQGAYAIRLASVSSSLPAHGHAH